ncbi:HdeD family acid-resistance protein [Alistipes sp.]|uniref:HdeD family acid-resistance protein n=1 Tax=Alistipes sp. TaxID=1872444 RepID=UPI003AF11D93
MNTFSSLIENSKRAVRYWWLLLIVGIALFVVGILVFVYPAQSYLGMALIFGWLMLITGILEVVLASVNRHFITGRGWMLAGGIIEIILGLILIFNVSLSAATLPIFLGFWLLFRGFSAIGLGGDMNALEVAGSGWTIFTGILLVLCALWILFQPLVFGTAAVIIWVGISLLFAGIASFALALQLRRAHHCLERGERADCRLR